MISLSLFALLLFIAFVAIKWGPLKVGPVLLGAAVGLTMAGTPFGPPTVTAIDTVTSTIVTSFGAFTSGSSEDAPSHTNDEPNVVVRPQGGHR